jgi:hypothetical protein
MNHSSQRARTHAAAVSACALGGAESSIVEEGMRVPVGATSGGGGAQSRCFFESKRTRGTEKGLSVDTSPGIPVYHKRGLSFFWVSPTQAGAYLLRTPPTAHTTHSRCLPPPPNSSVAIIAEPRDS